uniref:hypothetical protein n=1 Tax=uncultured Sphingomonas sp. TaxID=158754 RepID=UPI0035CAFD21
MLYLFEADALERKDWNRIGLAAAVVLVPGGFVLGAVLAARRYARKDAPGVSQAPMDRRDPD